MIREALIRALFVRNDRVLPREIIADLTTSPRVTVKVKDDAEVRKLVNVLNGQESTVSLGLAAEDYNYFRTQLGVGKDREVGLTVRPRTLLTYDWLVPEPRGVQLDFSAYADIEFDEAAHRAIAQVGAPWKRLYDGALAAGHFVPFVPTVPLDFAVGDAVWGDAPFASYDGELTSYVNALRTISAYGHRTRIGFEDVSNGGTGYDLLHALFPVAGEFTIPISIALRLAPKPAAQKTLTYSFDDGAKLAAALDKLTRTTHRVGWAHITDQVGAAALRPGIPGEAFTVQVALGGTPSGLAIREKGIDASLAGFKSKTADVPNPYDVPADGYAKTAKRIEQSVFVGEIRLPSAALGDLATRIKALGQQSAAKAGLFASLRSTGIVSALPSFETTKDRNHYYDLSKGVAKVAEKIPGAVFTSRLAHLWSEDSGYIQRIDILRRVKLAFDTAHVVQPLVKP
jgi:FAD/FMN-containing dehydrogenase